MEKRLIHTRNISVNCYETKENTILVEGSLADERYYPYLVYALNERRPAGKIHHLIITMELSVPDLKIVSVDAAMPTVPDEGCRDVLGLVRRLEGRSIKPGFTSEVRQLLGRSEGCLHLTNLVVSMGSAAVQGLWTYFSREREGVVPSPPRLDEAMLVDSCFMWRKEGAFLKRLRERQAAQEKAAKGRS